MPQLVEAIVIWIHQNFAAHVIVGNITKQSK